MSDAYALISCLDDSKTDWKFILKVDRIWLATRPGVPKEEANLSCIAIDKKGDAIHIEIDRDQVPTYIDALKEGNLYVISHFHVVPTTSFEPIEKDIKIEFMIGTSIADYTAEPIDIPNHVFNLYDYEKLKERDGLDDYTIDLIGLLATVRDTETIQTKFGPTTRTNIVLLDEQEGAANVTLWGSASDDFNQLDLRGRSDTIILIVTSLMVRQVGGVYRASSTSGTKLYANLAHHTVDAYMERYVGVDMPPKLLPPETIRRASLGAHQGVQEMTIRQLLELPRTNLRDRKFSSTVIIYGFDMRNFWYYYGCKYCSKTLPTRGKSTTCTGCGSRAVQAVPCYKLEAHVMDETGLALFLFFSNAAEQLVGLPLSSLLLREPSTRHQLPPRVKALIDTRWELQLIVNFKSYTAVNLVFNVSRVVKQLPRATLALPPPPSPPLTPAPEQQPQFSQFDKKAKQAMTAEELEDDRKRAKGGLTVQKDIILQPPTLREKESATKRKRAKGGPPLPKESTLHPLTLREKIAVRLQELRETIDTLEQCKKILLEEFSSKEPDQAHDVRNFIESETTALEDKILQDAAFWKENIDEANARADIDQDFPSTIEDTKPSIDAPVTTTPSAAPGKYSRKRRPTSSQKE